MTAPAVQPAPNPVPSIALDGAFLDCTTQKRCPISGDLVMPDTGLTLMGAMSIDWGRDDPHSQPAASVLNLTLWDPTGHWLQRIAARDAIGKPVAVWYDRAILRPGDTRTIRWIFQGFTTNVDVVAERIRTPCGLTDGYIVKIQASDRAGFLGNVEWFSGELPQETMLDRAIRVRNQSGPIGIRQLYFESRYVAGLVSSADVSSKTALDTANDIYESFAQSWTYNPDRNVITRIPAGAVFSKHHLYLGVTNLGDPGRVSVMMPRFQDTTGQEDPIDLEPLPPAYIPACKVTSEIALQSSTMSDITTVSCKWNDMHAGGNQWTTIIHTRDVLPRRLLRFDSLFIDGVYIDTVMQDVVRYVSREATRPMHPPITWNTRDHGLIESWDTFEVLTRPSQTVSATTIAGSPFTASLGLPPWWNIAGGTITYEAGYWEITCNPAPAAIELPDNFTPITWSTFTAAASPISYADDQPGPHWHLDGSLDYYTLSFVGDPTVYQHY